MLPLNLFVQEKCVRTLISSWELPHVFFSQLKQKGQLRQSQTIFKDTQKTTAVNRNPFILTHIFWVMQSLHFLTAKHSREILHKITDQWGGEYEYLLEEYALAQSNEGKVYLISRDIEKIDVSKFRLNSVGMYLVDIENSGLRLSIEGAQLVGAKATKNIFEVSEAQARQWLSGNEIDLNEEDKKLEGFIIIKFKKDIIGCGRISKGILYNFVPKNRRTKELIT